MTADREDPRRPEEGPSIRCPRCEEHARRLGKFGAWVWFECMACAEKWCVDAQVAGRDGGPGPDHP